ncbi:hypothetical protein TNCV_1159011 [Trichonephila clavipes]|nr:hypothetical protein TNCV_1159011 [Trichonephila clavipes]
MAEENISDSHIRDLIKVTRTKIYENLKKGSLKKELLLFQLKDKLKVERERRRQDRRLHSTNYRDVNLNHLRRVDANQLLNDDDDSLGLENFFAELRTIQALDPSGEN